MGLEFRWEGRRQIWGLWTCRLKLTGEIEIILGECEVERKRRMKMEYWEKPNIWRSGERIILLEEVIGDPMLKSFSGCLAFQHPFLDSLGECDTDDSKTRKIRTESIQKYLAVQRSLVPLVCVVLLEEFASKPNSGNSEAQTWTLGLKCVTFSLMKK